MALNKRWRRRYCARPTVLCTTGILNLAKKTFAIWLLTTEGFKMGSISSELHSDRRVLITVLLLKEKDKEKERE